jgi:hypothetical protein
MQAGYIVEKFSLPLNMEARRYYSPVIEAVKTRAYQEIVYMTKILNKPVDSQPFIEIVFNLMQLLNQAAFLLNSGAIDPWVEICTAPHDTEKPIYDKTLRIGVYPVAANPFHWAHLLIGLSVLTRFKLDKIIYVITGHDPRKPSMVAAEIRHLIGEEVLKIFTPLFGYSSMALENDLDGETNIFEILALNPEQKIEAFYIVGSDHYHRVNPKTGRIDTIQKIENNLRSKTGMLDDDVHSVSAIFIERGFRENAIETMIEILFIPEIPFAASST